jgi:hypothetical protein
VLCVVCCIQLCADTKTSPLDELELAERAARPGAMVHSSGGKRRRWETELADGDAAQLSGSDVSLASDDTENVLTTKEQGPGRASGSGDPHGSRESTVRQCPPRQGIAQPGIVAKPKQHSSGLAGEQQRAIERVLQLIRELRAEPPFAATARRALVGEALMREEEAGRCFGGSSRLYSRRRSAIDACLRLWPTDLP